jgi:HrpA-like RNA helicase
MASVVLQLKALGIPDVTRFDYMDPPPLDSRTAITLGFRPLAKSLYSLVVDY